MFDMPYPQPSHQGGRARDCHEPPSFSGPREQAYGSEGVPSGSTRPRPTAFGQSCAGTSSVSAANDDDSQRCYASRTEIDYVDASNAQTSDFSDSSPGAWQGNLPDFARGLPSRPRKRQRTTGETISSYNKILPTFLNKSSEAPRGLHPPPERICYAEYQFAHGSDLLSGTMDPVSDNKGSPLTPCDLAAESTRTKGPHTPVSPPPSPLHQSTAKIPEVPMDCSQFQYNGISELSFLTANWSGPSFVDNTSAASLLSARNSFLGDFEYCSGLTDNPYDVFLDEYQHQVQASAFYDQYADPCETLSWSQQPIIEAQSLSSQSVPVRTSVEGEAAAPDKRSTIPRLAITCTDCGYSFTGDFRTRNLKRHKQTVHSTEVYHCDVAGCDRSFKRSDAVHAHKRRSHPKLSSSASRTR
ncbi:uncharacterized protein M421DRAFT_259938 [Didymella exigua CBS 183.55]|uniref:C2H2-type domain-containing protein n=1 Tax=Didymella exigua CBS 183.55 TaxID=1150837 RepID=A0A6A5RID9_9PLEO|nr:uncharacterized protein M421DRAFT_259938 [Didymella exigua CBS 183.55]KAF1925357.1 hypothetical protein M421DRAFT_259938 [Didymella exigua CBS 183.55]